MTISTKSSSLKHSCSIVKTRSPNCEMRSNSSKNRLSTVISVQMASLTSSLRSKCFKISSEKPMSTSRANIDQPKLNKTKCMLSKMQWDSKTTNWSVYKEKSTKIWPHFKREIRCHYAHQQRWSQVLTCSTHHKEAWTWILSCKPRWSKSS